MRILNIFFKNINSLEGEGRVHFDQGPIADSGVFAITGPNGSGKTSILDVITLGLYGETFRFDKPAEHVMTKQTNECFAQVEFALGEEKFRSSWRVKLGDSSTNGPQMSLQRLDDLPQLLAETPVQVRSQITELTGMDFHKFSKSIMLPQGDFAAFLHALDSERLDILEKISGSNLYDDYRQQAKTHHGQAQARCEQIQQDIASLPLLNQDAMEAIALDLQDFQEQYSELKLQQQSLQQQREQWQNHAELNKQRQQLERNRQQLQTQLAEDRQKLETIDISQTANGHRNDLALLDNKRTQLEQQQQALDNYRRELAVLQQQLGSELNPPTDITLAEQQKTIDELKLAISELKLELPRQNELVHAIQQQLAANRTTAEETEQWLQAHRGDAVLLTEFPELARLRNLRTELAELAGKQKKQTGWSKNTTTALKKNRDLLDSTTAELSKLQVQIIDEEATLVEIAQGKSFEELKDLLLEQQIRVNEYQEMCELAEVTVRLSNKGWFSWFGGGSNKQSELADETELLASVEALQQEKIREENIIKVLEQAIRNEAMIKKMSADRTRLIEGQPCYLCGSLDHPFVRKSPGFNDAKKALVDQRGRIQALKSRIDSANSQLKAVQKASSQQTAKQARLQQIRAKWSLLVNRYAIMRDGMTIDNLSLQKELLKEESEELGRISELVKQHAQLQRSIAKATTDIERKQIMQETLTKTLADLEAAMNNRPPEFTEAEQRHSACQAEEQTLIAKLSTQLMALGEKLPAKGKENPVIDRLNSRRQDYQVYALRQAAMQDETQQLNGRLQDAQTTVIAYQQRLTSSLEALREQEISGLHLTVIEKQKLIVDADHQLRVLQIEFDALESSLNQQLAGTFGSVDKLRELLQLLDQAPAIEQRYLAEKAKLETTEKQWTEILDRYHAELATLQNFDEVAAQRDLQSLEQRIDIAEQEMHSQQNKLDKQQHYRDRYLLLRDQLDQQQVILDQALAELALINDERGGFRQRIQQLMIEKLLTQTNRILEKLSGRYYVRGSASDNGLALAIEDTKQKNLHRQPQTLSGGESFVVSLALALALAEVANNGRAIDSLFIDEGFGNLDAESLNLTMITLEGLKTQGKTVGVISHVDGVQKRIKTRLELVKKANGLSELKMVA